MTEALVVTYMKGQGGAMNCQEPRPNGRLCLGSASAKVEILGHRPVRMCRGHAIEARKIWDAAFAGFTDETTERAA